MVNIGLVILIVMIIVIVVTIFKSQDLLFIFSLIKKYIGVVILLGLIVFLVISFYNIQNNYDTDLNSFGGVINTFKIYFAWLKVAFANVGKVTANAVNLDWFNTTNITGK
jgi:hypothetical protein